LELPHDEQSEDLVQVRTGKYDAFDRCVTNRTGMQQGLGLDLKTDVRGGVQEKPGLGDFADGDLKLSSRFTSKSTVAESPAIRAATIPLRESAAGR
jgi:hypothetical protein